MKPSTYLHEMSLDTEQKLASTREMRLPRIIELLDMSETTHQKVYFFSYFFLLSKSLKDT